MNPTPGPAPQYDSLVLESIQHQDGRFFKELSNIIRDMQFVDSSDFYTRESEDIDVFDGEGEYAGGSTISRTNTNQVALREHELRIESMLRDAFKCNVTFRLGLFTPSVRMYDQYHNHPMRTRDSTRYFLQQEEEFIARFIKGRDNGRAGGVNLKEAKLSGVFSELPFSISMPIGQFCRYPNIPKSWKWTPEEAASIILHEMGHFFVYCEYFARTVSTNQALAAVSGELLKTHSVAMREVIIATCKQDLNLNNLDQRALAGSNDNRVIELAIITEAVEKSRSELNCNIYDHTSFEYLADAFAVRMGGGRHSILAQAKLDNMFGNTSSYDSTPVFMLRQAFTLVLTLVPIFAVAVLFGALDDAGDNKYDTTEARMRRIRNEMVMQVKNKYLGKQAKKDLVDDINAVDEVLKKVRDRRSWATTLGDFVIPVYRRYRKTMQLQKQLEQIASNSLFVRAAELSTLK